MEQKATYAWAVKKEQCQKLLQEPKSPQPLVGCPVQVWIFWDFVKYLGLFSYFNILDDCHHNWWGIVLLFKKTYGKEGDAVDSGQWVHSKENLRFTEFNRIENYRELKITEK